MTRNVLTLRSPKISPAGITTSWQEPDGRKRAASRLLLSLLELLPGPMRYSELVASLGGIATNLLADRLRSLESVGVIERWLGQTRGVVYALTPWGRELREAIEALIRWSIPLMASGRGGDALQPRWLAVALEALLRGRTAHPSAELGIDVPGLFMTLRIDEEGPHVTVEPDRRPDTILEAEPEAVLGLAAGAITIDQMLSRATIQGDRRVLTTVLGATQT